jgi:nucleotide-binding universal stress UspA family protein
MKVLIATDGSDFSQQAVERCCQMFDESLDTEIRIISAAVPVILATDPYGFSAGYYNDLEKAAELQAGEAVTRAENEVRKHPGLAVELTSQVIAGEPKRVIVEEATRWGAELIVLGSHGYGFWQRALLGSVSDSVTLHAPCSVLVVRKDG